MLLVAKDKTVTAFVIALFALTASLPAIAQSYPNRTIHLIMPAPPGGNNDAVGRILAQGVSAILKVPVVVENRTGAGGIPGVQYAASQPADGYTLLFGITGTISILPHLKKLPYDPVTAFTPVSMVATTPLVLVATKSFETKDFDSYMQKLRQNPGRFNYASPGIGTIMHIAMEALKIRSGVDIVHVPYSNVPMIQPLLANDVQTAYDATPSSAPHIASGSLTSLAVTGTTRASSLPGVPTMTEKGYPGMETMIAWMGLLAPAGTPADVVATVNGAVRQVLSDPEVKEKMTRLGADPVFGTPAEMTTFMDATSRFYKDVITTAKITADN